MSEGAEGARGEPGPVPGWARANFETMLRAARDGRLAVMSCSDAATGEPRYVVCAVGGGPGGYEMVPFGHLAEGDPFAMYRPPGACDAQALVGAPAAGLAPPGRMPANRKQRALRPRAGEGPSRKRRKRDDAEH